MQWDVFDYAQLLAATMARPRRLAVEPTSGERLAELLRCRGQLGHVGARRAHLAGLLTAIGDQLAYDVALMGWHVNSGSSVT